MIITVAVTTPATPTLVTLAVPVIPVWNQAVVMLVAVTIATVTTFILVLIRLFVRSIEIGGERRIEQLIHRLSL